MESRGKPMKKDFAFVILHYMTADDTIECVESILKLHGSYGIVVVDNGSTNDSFITLHDKFNGNEHIHLIKLDKNFGFSKGNNIGYQYARDELEADFICCINNDTVIKDAEFIERVEEFNSSSPFDILGPKVISLIDGFNQNPVPYVLKSRKRLLKRRVRFRVAYLLSLIYLDGLVIAKNEQRNDTVDIHGDYQLHGCCLIFANNYLKEQEKAFDDTIFMFCEEDILKHNSIDNNYSMVYCENAVIYHKEGSTTSRIQSPINKRRFYYYNTIRSLSHLDMLMKKSNR